LTAPSGSRQRPQWDAWRGLFLTGQDIVTDGVGGALMAGVLTAWALLRRNVLKDVLRRTSPGQT
jgi:all-trans-retinol 13,14-reductase